MLSIGINLFMKKLESFFRYLWIFSRKEKSNLKEPSELLPYYFKDSVIYK